MMRTGAEFRKEIRQEAGPTTVHSCPGLKEVYPNLWLSARRKRIIPVAVTVADLPLAVMDEQFRALVLRARARRIDGLGLRVVERRKAIIAFTSDAPLVAVRYYMLVLAHRLEPPIELDRKRTRLNSTHLVNLYA